VAYLAGKEVVEFAVSRDGGYAAVLRIHKDGVPGPFTVYVAAVGAKVSDQVTSFQSDFHGDGLSVHLGTCFT